MNDVTSPISSPPVRPAAGSPAPRPAMRRGPSSGNSVRFAVDAPPLPLLMRRPAYLRENTAGSLQSLCLTLPDAYPPTPAPLLGETDAQPAPRPPRGAIFGLRTAYKPLWVLAIGSAGNALYGNGTVALERGLWPRRLAPTPDNPMPPPRLSPLFGHVPTSIGLGAATTVLGVGLAGTASTLFYLDARRLARRQNPAAPNYLRPTTYFCLHLAGIGLSVSSKFMLEALRDALPRDYTWAAAVPGIIGQSIFAVTQANAASSCEILNSRQPLRHRAAVGFAARFGISGYTVWAAMQGLPNFSPYAREMARVLSQASLTVAFALPLTTARLGRHQGVDFASHQPEPSWAALQILGTYIAGRVLAGFGPDIIQSGLFANVPAGPFVFGGATALAVGTATCVASLMAFRQHVAAYSTHRANLLFGGASFALLCILAYVGVSQYAHATHNQKLVWAALVPGVIGSGLRLAILPEDFSFAELRLGDSPLPNRLYWTEASRGLAALFFGVWGVMSAQPNVNIYLREAVAVAAGSFATLGMALPTTTSRRALPQYAWPMLSPGATPPAELGGFTWTQTASAP